MENKVLLSAHFLKKAKRLLKKYSTLQKNLTQLERSLIINPQLESNYGSNIIRSDLQMNQKGAVKAVVLEL